MILDRTLPGGGEFIGAIAEATGASVLVRSAGGSPDAIVAAMRAAAAGANGDGNGHTPRTELTDREQQVLALIAAGHPTREVAQQLCYSERTVKGVLHDIAAKLDARSRSQAVACAVREGLI